MEFLTIRLINTSFSTKMKFAALLGKLPFLLLHPAYFQETS